MSTQRQKFLDIHKDLQPHCQACVTSELKATQLAVTFKEVRKDGYEFRKHPTSRRRWCWTQFCPGCGRKTIHRQLLSLDKQTSSARANTPEWLKKRAKAMYNGIDAFDDFAPNEPVEVDHRRPRVTYSSDEKLPSKDISDKELADHYMLLRRSNNQQKSRKCEKCQRSGRRPASRDGILWFFVGTEVYDPEINCKGCYWAFPEEWRRQLNQKLRNEVI